MVILTDNNKGGRCKENWKNEWRQRQKRKKEWIPGEDIGKIIVMKINGSKKVAKEGKIEVESSNAGRATVQLAGYL